jgi:hypothetical protein
VVGSQRLFLDSECALEERLGLGVAALRAVVLGEVVEGLSDVGVLGAERLLADGKRTLK